jgi:small subunit ribosomal protein S7
MTEKDQNRKSRRELRRSFLAAKAIGVVPERDPLYKSRLVTFFILQILKCGKKTLAQKIIYETLERVKLEEPTSPLLVLERAVTYTMPKVIVISRRKGRKVLKVPIQVRLLKGVKFAVKRIVEAARGRSGKNQYSEKLALEIFAASKRRGRVVRAKRRMHKLGRVHRTLYRRRRFRLRRYVRKLRTTKRDKILGQSN